MLFGTIKGYLNVKAQIELREWTEGVVTGLNQGEKQVNMAYVAYGWQLN